jgi:RNA polymerase sigma factor (TIGR02999 family)
MSDDANAASSGQLGALDRLTAAEYDALRELTHRLKRRRTSRSDPGTNSLVHEAYVRLKRAGNEVWNDRTHFLAVAALQLRHILVDHARTTLARKRGGDSVRVSLDDQTASTKEPALDVLALDESLNRLAREHARRHRVAELRLFGGLSVEEIGEVLDVSPRTVKEDWRHARAWLARDL